MAKAFAIKDWGERFQTAASRKVEELSWLPVPIRQSTRYRRLASSLRGAEAYGIFMALAQVAANCKPARGVLADCDGPLTLHDLASKTCFPVAVIERAITLLSSPAVAWLVGIDVDSESSCLPDGSQHAPRPSSTSEIKSESERENKKKKAGAGAIAWATETGWEGIDDAHRTAWACAYPACDVPVCLAQADQWLRANPTRATKSNWQRFITNWLKREQDRGGTRNGHAKPGAPAGATGFSRAELERMAAGGTAQ